MKKLLFSIALQMVGLAASHAQQIKGLVKDEKGEALSFATVSLIRAKDDAVLKTQLSKEGTYEFSPSNEDSLYVKASYVGYATASSQKFLYTGKTVQLPTLLLKTQNTLQAVTVTAKKEAVEARSGKTVLNVAASVNSTGSDALDLLRKAPGVMVDKDEQLSINGKSGSQVFIDNRPSNLSGEALASYLKSIPSSSIESIEIINNPSVSYEASGTAGIINIRLKKNKAFGWNGSVNAGLSASKNGQWDDGFSLNYRNKAINAFGSYNGNNGKLQNEFSLYRVLQDTTFDQQNDILLKKNVHTYKTGVDYTINSKNVLGVMVNGTVSSPTVENSSLTPIAKYSTGQVDRILKAANVDKQTNNNVNVNLNYNFRDSVGRNFTINADYGHYFIKQDQWQPNTFLATNGETELNHLNYKIVSPTSINIYSLKADYETPLAKGKLGFGGKFGLVKTDNDFNQYNENSGVVTLDRERSNFFGYKENVNAAYLNYSRELKGLSLQAGLRAEQTQVTGNLQAVKKSGDSYVADNSGFKRDYIDFFPSVSVTIAPKTANQLTLAYSRRIDRPVYQDLNPFEYRINEYAFHKGSIDLTPQYSNTISATHTFKYKLNSTLSYSHLKDLFGQVVDTARGTKGYLSPRNLASQDITNLNVSYPFQYKNYSLFTNVNAYYSRYRANYGAGRDIDLDVWAANIFAQNSYRFGSGWTAELSGFYTTPSIWQGTFKTTRMWSVDAGVQKNIMQGNATIKAGVSDVFKSMHWSASSDFSGQKIWAAGQLDSRQFKLSFTYRFGNKQLKAARQYQTGAEEESKRVQSSGGLGH